MWGKGKRGQCCCLAAGGLLSTHPISSQFTHFPCATGALAVALVVVPRMSGFVYILDCAGPLNRLSWETGSFCCCPTPHWFLQPGIMRLYFPGTRTLGCAVWSGAGFTCSQGIPSDLYSTTYECRTVCSRCHCTATSHPLHSGSLCLPFLPIWMNLASLNPWLLDFHTVQFSGSSGCWFFGVFFEG